MICFDMDGTIADLYNVKDWLLKLREEDSSPYEDADPLVNMTALKEILKQLQTNGWEIRIISWLSKESSSNYDKKVRSAKRNWLTKYSFPANKIHIIKYGRTKADCVRKECGFGILIDDDPKVRRGWNLGPTVNPQETNILDFLRTL